jgi:hypothetical protein
MKKIIYFFALSIFIISCQKKQEVTQTPSVVNIIQDTSQGYNYVEVECISGGSNAYLNIVWDFGIDQRIPNTGSSGGYYYNDSLYHKTMNNPHFIQGKTILSDSIRVMAWSSTQGSSASSTDHITVRVNGIVVKTWLTTNTAQVDGYIKIK